MQTFSGLSFRVTSLRTARKGIEKQAHAGVCTAAAKLQNVALHSFKKNKCYIVHYAITWKQERKYSERSESVAVPRTGFLVLIYTTTWNRYTSTKNTYCSFRFLSHPAYLEAPAFTGRPLWWRSYHFSRPVSVLSDKALYRNLQGRIYC